MLAMFLSWSESCLRHMTQLRHGTSQSGYRCCFVCEKSWLQIATNNVFAGCLAYSPTLKMEAVRSSETSVNFYHSTWLHISEDNTLDWGFSWFYAVKPNAAILPQIRSPLPSTSLPIHPIIWCYTLAWTVESIGNKYRIHVKYQAKCDLRFSRRCWDATPCCLVQLAEKALDACFLLVAYLDYTSTLKMETVRSSETSV
jgi:hypothetical protein